jgi:ribose transport system permease protein
MSAPAAPRVVKRWAAGARNEGWVDVLFVPVVIIGLGIYFSIASPYFLTSLNITNLLIQGSILAFVAFGVTFVILAGELDLSVGSGVGLVSVLAATVMRDQDSVLLGIIAAFAVGIAIGAVNGFVVTKLEVPSFIATFGMLVIANGIALAITDGGVVTGVPIDIGNLALKSFLGVRWMIWLVVIVFIVLYVIQTQTAFGRRVMAVGGNREAARLAGIPVNRVRFFVFLVSGATIAIGGLALTSRVVSGQPNGGTLLELDAVAAIVIGGTSIFGGRGSLVRTLFGVLLIAELRNGLDLVGVGDDLKQVIIGAVLILAASVAFIRGRIRIPYAMGKPPPKEETTT